MKSTNPYIIIIGIEKYRTNKWCSLDGVKQDVAKMIELWHDIYGYKNMSVICSFNVDKNSDNQSNIIVDKIYKKYGHYFSTKENK